MTHAAQVTFSGDVAAQYFALSRGTEGEDERPGLQAAGMQDHPMPYVDVPRARGTHYCGAAAESEHFGAYVHDAAEQQRLWTPDLLRNAARVIGGDPRQDPGDADESASATSPADRRSAAA